MSYMKEDMEIMCKYDTMQEMFKWVKELPYLHFKQEWNVKIIPPFAGAIIRFYVDYNNKHVSVYFDAYDRLGLVGKPYFELYNGEECYRYYINETEKMMKDIEKYLEE